MKPTLLLLVMIWSATVCGQMDPFPCKNANTDLKTLFSGGTLDNLYVHDCYGRGLSALSTSFLSASGKAPVVVEEGDEPGDTYDYDLWTCMYSAGMLQDNDPKTAWVEGVESYGEGEIVVVPCLDLSKPIEIWAGYGKSESLFLSNSRPKRIMVSVIEAQNPNPTQYGTQYGPLKLAVKKELELKSLNGYQPLAIPSFERRMYTTQYGDAREAMYFLAIQIVDVYPGTKWKDTCISEVRNKQ